MAPLMEWGDMAGPPHGGAWLLAASINSPLACTCNPDFACALAYTCHLTRPPDNLCRRRRAARYIGRWGKALQCYPLPGSSRGPYLRTQP